MVFEVIWDEKAYDELEKLEKIVARRIFKKVSELTENPYSKDLIKLKGEEGFRLRVGNYRIVLTIEKNKILILKVGHRKNIYDR